MSISNLGKCDPFLNNFVWIQKLPGTPQIFISLQINSLGFNMQFIKKCVKTLRSKKCSFILMMIHLHYPMDIIYVKWVSVMSQWNSGGCSVSLPKITQAANNTAGAFNHICSHPEPCLYPFRKPWQDQFEIVEGIRSIHCIVPLLLQAQLSLFPGCVVS